MQGIFIARASFAWSISACFAFLPVFLETELGFAAVAIGVLIGAQQFVGGGAQPITGRLSDIFSRTVLAVIGSIAVAIALATVAISESYPIMLVSFLIFEVDYRAISTVKYEWFAHCEKHHRLGSHFHG